MQDNETTVTLEVDYEEGVGATPVALGDPLLAKPAVASNHVLVSKERGESEVEQMAHKFEERRADRIVVTMSVRIELLSECRRIAMEKGYPKSRIHLSDLQEWRHALSQQVPTTENDTIRHTLGILPDDNVLLLRVLDRACQVVERNYNNEAVSGDCYFYYQDFNFYYTRVESRWPWMRPGFHRSLAIIFIYYFITPIWFCHVVPDDGVCQKVEGKPYSGWLSAIYFASTTLSTVGYGDLTVSKDSVWHVFVGTVFMIVSNIVLVFAMSTALGDAFHPLQNVQTKIINLAMGPPSDHELLWKKVRRLRATRILEVVTEFVLLNGIGVAASQFFVVYNSQQPHWNYMTSIYWAVQTTTTIGYGDLTMAFELRWFQVFYLILSTYFVGNALSGLTSLRDEMDRIRRRTAWQRREVTRGMMEEMQGFDHDDKIDQFEFALASLLALGTVSSDDLTPIMDKFRELADADGVIRIAHARETHASDMTGSTISLTKEELLAIHEQQAMSEYRPMK